MTTKKLISGRTGLFVAFILLLLPAFSINAQELFSVSNPAGKYVITDYLNKKITLNINKPTSTDMLGMPKGTGTITINGRTLNGNWNMSDFNGKKFLAFETYNNVRITYNLPSGSAKIDQIVISQDGRASYNISELLKTDANWVKAKRAVGSTKKTSSKKRAR